MSVSSSINHKYYDKSIHEYERDVAQDLLEDERHNEQ